QTDLVIGFTIQAGIDKLDVIAKMRLKKDLIIFDNPSNQTNYSTYKNPMAGVEFLYTIATVIKESVLNESLLIDESNTIIHDKTCAIVSKYMAENIPIFHYLGLIELLNIDANAIMKILENFFVTKMLNTDDLMHFSSDSASVML
ncbi:11723_t:CDS:2, partial [Funneliformis mosseae]